VSRQYSEQLEKAVEKNMENNDVKDLLANNIHLVIKLQAWARGNKCRNNVKFMKSKQIGSDKYFTMAEFKETISISKTKENQSFGQHIKTTKEFLN